MRIPLMTTTKKNLLYRGLCRPTRPESEKRKKREKRDKYLNLAIELQKCETRG